MINSNTSAPEILLIFPPLNPMIRHPEIGPPQLLGWLRRRGVRAGMVDLNAAFLRAWMGRDDVLDELLTALSGRARGRLAEELRALRHRADALASQLPDGPGVRGGRPASRKVLDHLHRVVALPLAGAGVHPDPGPQALGALLRAAAAERDLSVLAEHRLARTIQRDLLGPDGWTPEDLRDALSRPSAPFDGFLDAHLASRITEDLLAVALSVHGSSHLAAALRIAAWLKARRPGLAVVLGGPWCMAAADVVTGDPGLFAVVDGVCTGGGEGPLGALVEALRDGKGVAAAPGFLVRVGEEVRSSGALPEIPLDALGPPDYSDVDWGLHPERIVAFRTVRGCTWSRCLFCYHVVGDAQPRDDPGPTEDLAAGLRELIRRSVESGEVEGIFLADPATTPRALDMVAAVMESEGVPFAWEAMARFEPGITAARVGRWAAAGCCSLSFGLETNDPGELRRLHKGIRLDVVEACLAACREAGVVTRVFALDYPSQPAGAYRATMDWLLDRSDLVGDPIPLRFELGRCSGVYRDPAAFGIVLGEDHGRWYDVFDVPFTAPGWQGPDAFGEISEELMVEFERRRHKTGSGGDLILFLPCATSKVNDKGLFAYPACYQLEASLKADPAVAGRWEVEVLPFTPPASGPMAYWDRLLERILYDVQSRAPRVAAFSLYGWSLEPSVRLARALRGTLPGTLLIAGGPEVAEREDFVEQWDVFDVLIEGDGEAPLAELLRRLAAGEALEGIPSMSWRGADGWRHAPRRSGGLQPPIPDFYTPNPQHMAREAYYLSTRGCDHACRYCQWATQPLRRKPQDQVIRELEAITASPSLRCIIFFDYDMFQIYRDEPAFFRRILEVLRARGDLKVEFFTSPGNLGQPELPEVVETLHLPRINLGVQSMSPAALRAVNRGWAVQDLDGLDALASALRRHVVIELVYPLPEETPDSFFQGLDRLVRMGYSRFQIFPLIVLRGTELRRNAATWGLRYIDAPPSHALETATFPAAAMREARGVAWVLSLLLEFNDNDPDDLVALDAWVRKTPGLIGELRARVRDGVPLDRILGDALAAIHGADFVGADRIVDFLAISGRNEILAPRTAAQRGEEASPPAGAVAPAARGAFPSAAALAKLLTDAGALVLEERLTDGALEVKVRLPAGVVDLRIFGEDDGRLYYKAAGRYKVAYSGPLEDLAVMDALVRYLEDYV
ncbi:MAG: radical SAM protein [Pseudomonadota bacterium]